MKKGSRATCFPAHPSFTGTFTSFTGNLAKQQGYQWIAITLSKKVSFLHEEERIMWKKVTSSVLLLPLCNISLHYAIHKYIF